MESDSKMVYMCECVLQCICVSQLEGAGYGKSLTLNRAQFCEKLMSVWNKGTSAEVRNNMFRVKHIG